MEEKRNDKAFRMDRIDRVVGGIFTVFTYVGIIAVIFIMMNTTINVITRSFFSYAINGSVQLSQIVLTLVALSALPIVTMFNTHIKVDVVAEKLPQKGQNILQIMNLVLCGAMMFVTCYYTFIKAFKARTMGLSFDVPKFPHWIIYMMIAIMMGISGICAFYNVFHFIRTGTVIGPSSFSEIKKRLQKGGAGKETTDK